MVATIYCDASFLPEDNIAGYAYWIKSYQGSKQLARICKADIEDIFLAETYAIYQAVGHATHYYKNLTHVNLFSDSVGAVKLLTNFNCKPGKDKKGAALKRIYDAYQNLVREAKLEVTLQYREGHGKEAGNGAYAMKWCNTMARQITLKEAETRKKSKRHVVPAAQNKGKGPVRVG